MDNQTETVVAPLPAYALTMALGLIAIFLLLFVFQPFAETTSQTSVSEPAGTLWPHFTPEVQHWKDQILRWSAEMGVDPNLIATVMQIESCGDPNVASPAGAQGLFQVMPFHFRPGEDMLDPDTNARHGLQYLKAGLSLAQGNAGLALAGYNGGHSLISKSSANWPSETRQYYYWGSRLYYDAMTNAPGSSTLAEWLAAGGQSLCQRAHRRLALE